MTTGNTAVVVSVLPLAPAAREAMTGAADAVRFLDLQRLRRNGARALWRELRAARVEVAVVAASEDELREFGDYLTLLACAVPARRREIRVSGKPASELRAAPALLLSSVRAAAAWARGAGSVVATWARARALLRSRFASRRLAAAPTTCLYLKPGLTFGKSVGGSVTHVAGVANALARRGCRVRLLASQPQAMLDPSVEQVVHRADFRLALLHELNQHQYRPRYARRALLEAGPATPDFVYQRYALNDLSGATLRKRLGCPLVVEFNGSEVWIQRHWGRPLLFEDAARDAERAALRAADLVVAVSQEVAAQAREAGVEEERLVFVPNGVDAREFDPDRFSPEDRACVRTGLGIPPAAFLYTFVGTFGAWHGTDVLAAALLALDARHPGGFGADGAHVLFVGDGPLGAGVREALAPLVARRSVTFAGLVAHEETPGILAASDVLVSPHKPNDDRSPFFGSPTKLFEYMAMARPIVASDLDQIGEVLRGWPERDGRPCALLVSPGDAESLADGLDRARRMSAASRAEMGARARAHVLRHFTWDRSLAAVLDRLCRNPA